MKRLINKHLFTFICAVVLYTIAFRFLLSTGLGNDNYFLVIGSSIAYFFAIFFTARAIGKEYYAEYIGNDIGLVWHGITFIFATLTSYLWYKLGYPATGESIIDLYGVTAGWGVGLIVHFIVYIFTRKDAIKGIAKDEIFE